MALIWTESWDAVAERVNDTTLNGSAKQTVNGSFLANYGVTEFSPGRTGNAGGNYYLVQLGGADQDDLLVVGCAFYAASAYTSEKVLFEFKSDATATLHVSVTITGSDHKIRVYRGGTGGTLLGTASVTSMLDPSAFYHVEAKVRLSDTVGTIEVRVDETTVLSLSGLDTKNVGTMTLFDGVVAQGAFWNRIDDFYICNEQGSDCNDFLGAVHIETRMPDGNGASSAGVGSDGNSTDNYLLVDDAQTVVWASQSSDYVDFAATGDKDTYTFQDSAFPTGNAVKAVMVWVAAEKTDAGARHAAAVARLSGTEVTGADMPLVNGVFHAFGHAFETKPGGGSWTVADFNNAEFGVKATA